MVDVESRLVDEELKVNFGVVCSVVEVEVIGGVLDDVMVDRKIVVVASEVGVAEVLRVLEEAEVKSVVVCSVVDVEDVDNMLEVEEPNVNCGVV